MGKHWRTGALVGLAILPCLYGQSTTNFNFSTPQSGVTYPWTTSANWTPSPPASTTNATIDFTSQPPNADPIVLVNAASPDCQQLYITSSSNTPGTLTIEDPSLGTMAALIITGGLNNSSDGNCGINFLQNTTLMPVQGNQYRTLTVYGTSAYSGSIYGNGTIHLGAVTSSSNSCTLSGSSTAFNGPIQLNLGTLTANSPNALSPGAQYTLARGVQLILNYNNTIGSLSGTGNVNLNTYTLTTGADGLTQPSFNGMIYGSGGLALSSVGGTLTLGGNNIYTGTTTLNGGTLNANSATALSPFSKYDFPLGSTASLNVNASTAMGSLTGVGVGGTINLTAPYTLTVGADGTSPNPFYGTISGSGNLAVSGGGTLTLGSNNNYTGTTTVNGGVLALTNTGALTATSAVTVGSGAILKGIGTITSPVTVNSGGTIGAFSPGHALTIAGNLTLNAGSTTNVEVNAAGEVSQIAVTGTNTATLGGTLLLQFDPGTYPEFITYNDILTAYSLNGSSFSATAAYGYKAVPIYDRTPGSSSVSIHIFPINFHTIGEFTGNAKAVASYLLSLRFLPFMQSTLINLYELNDSELQAALNAISPSRNAFSTFALANTNFTLTNTLSDRLASQRQIHLRRKQLSSLAATELNEEASLWARNDFVRIPKNCDPDEMEEAPSPHGSSQTLARGENRQDIWLEEFGELAHQDAESQNPSFHYGTWGVLFGFDAMNSKGQIGTAAVYSYIDLTDASDAGQATLNFFGASVYGNIYFGKGYLELGVLSGYTHYTNQRNIVYQGFDAVAFSSHGGSSVVPRLNIGYDFGYYKWNIEPFASADCALIFQSKFSEHGAEPLNIRQARQFSKLLRAETGFHFYRDWMWDSWAIILKSKASYIYQKGFQLGELSNMAIVGAPEGFTVTTFTKAQKLLSPALELFASWRRSFFSLNYEGEFGSGYTSNELSARVGRYF